MLKFGTNKMEANRPVTFYELNAAQLNNMDNVISEFNNKIQQSRQLIDENGIAVEIFKNNFENNVQQSKQYAQQIEKLREAPQTIEVKNQIDALVVVANQIWLHITQESDPILASIQIVVRLLHDAQQILIDNRLSQWKYDQILAGYGDGNTGTSSNIQDKNPQLKFALDVIQQQFEALFDCCLKTRKLLDIIRGCYSQANYTNNFEKEATRVIKFILQKLIGSCFIVDEQPPQVIKKDTRFEANVRLLLPSYTNTITEIKPRVIVSILSELQTRRQLQQLPRPKEEKPTGEMVMDDCVLEKSPWHKHRYICHLRNIQLKKIKRTDKKSSSSVMDEKFSMLFETTLQICNIPVNVSTTSLPMTVAVHGNQEHEGWATITWDNSFFEIGRMPFVTRGKVPWSHMEWALSKRFEYQTGCTLTEEHLQYLYEKIFGLLPKQGRSISWEKFCKDPLPDRSFSFFTWFYEATKLTRLHLSKQWNKGFIHGFISKCKTEELLRTCPAGTFLLRFSDSELGGISPAWVQRNADGLTEVKILQPITNNDFDNPKQTIGDIVKELADCTQLYPNTPNTCPIPKETAFSEYYTPIVKPTNGYVPKHRQFVTKSENRSIPSPSPSNIGSPNSLSQNSPPNWQTPNPGWLISSPNAAQSPHSASNPDDNESNIMVFDQCELDDEVMSILNQALSGIIPSIIPSNETNSNSPFSVQNCHIMRNKYMEMKNVSQNNMNQSNEIDAKISALCILISTFMQWCNGPIEHEPAEMFTIIENIVNQLVEIQNMVIQRLDQLKRDQYLSANQLPTPFEVKPDNKELDQMQNWFNKLFAGIISVCQIIDIVCITYIQRKNFDKIKLEVLHDKVLNLRKKLISSSLVIEMQPPQVIQKDTRFGATVRMLITEFGNTSNRPNISVSIQTEAQALTQLNQSMPIPEDSGRISQNVVPFEKDKLALKCKLKRMMIKKVTRSSEEASMTDKKYVLTFHSKFEIGDTQIDIWTMSLPIVVVVFGAQEPQAWATITWTNAFAETDDNPFSTVDSVTWPKLASVLNTKFECYVGSPLAYEDFRYLYAKIFGTTEINADATVSFAQFCKNMLPDRKFTFWDWFYAVIKLSRDHLREPWMEGLVTGFISRPHTEERLTNCPPGTFLLRFTDTFLGGISVAYVELQPDGKPRVAHQQPFINEDFRTNLIGDLIVKTKACTHLYPDIPKEQAFERYCTKKSRHMYSTHQVWRRR
ncbi:uncharacterized protein LOC129570447 [Sitodiplosis mosellana]|uniref:uncharacterized protein LOC129570447 n=1 Tax=Sitodiplosis mosellana TaxID=263140 RepID=UPI00244426C0|nr:uncharacterized protein LOC129570447 [Sitodiplosis mosellana]